MANSNFDFKNAPNALTEAYAREQDAKDPLNHLRTEFNIPSKGDLKRKRVAESIIFIIIICSQTVKLTRAQTCPQTNSPHPTLLTFVEILWVFNQSGLANTLKLTFQHGAA
jgi:hypothetical protein